MVELGSFHPPLLDLEPGGVGQDGRLERQLGPVGERGDHDRALAVGVGEAALRVWGAMVVEEALDVSCEHRPVPDGVHEPEQVHRHPRLVAVGVGDDDAGPVGPHLEDRSHGGVELGVDQKHVLAPVDRLDHDPGSPLDLTGALDDRLDAGRPGDEHRVAGDGSPPGGDGPVHRLLVGDGHGGVDPCVGKGLIGVRHRPVGDGHDLDTGHGLHRPCHTSAHVSGPTIPTLMGRPSCWRRSSARSTICIMPPRELAPTGASSGPDN